MSKWLRVVLAVLAIGMSACLAAAAEAKPEAAQADPPIIGVALQVRTAQGQPRAFDRPGLPPTYWDPGLPVVQGDRVTVAASIDPKQGKLEAVRLRLDNTVLLDRVKGPWQAEVDTARLESGHHLVEVWAETKSPDRFKSVTTTFLVVPRGDPLLRVLLPEGAGAGQPKLPQGSDPRLACQITSANPAVAKALKGTGPVTVEERTLLEVKAGRPGANYVYTLSRSGRVTYISPTIELLTYLELTPRRLDPSGLVAGEVVLAVWVGDGKGHFGPPCRVVLEVK